MEPHITHNLSCSSSEAQYPLNIKDDNSSSSSSSPQIYFEKNKSQIEWSKIIINNNSHTISNRIMNEEEINITNKSYEEIPREEEKKEKKINKKNKSTSKSKNKSKNIDKEKFYNKIKTKNNRSNKKLIKKYFGNKYKVLDNGILLKNLNNFKKDPKSKSPSEFNYFYISKKNSNNNNNDKDNQLKQINNNNNEENKIQDKITPPKDINQTNEKNLNLRLNNNSEEKERKDTFHVIYIKRPKRAFFTKVCKYKASKPIKEKEYKKLSYSSFAQTSIGINSKNAPNSSRITPVPMIIIPQRQKEKSKTLVRNKTSSINDDNNNLDNKLISLSTTSLKKITSNSNVSLNFSKSINNNIINNNLKKRPLSSINIIRKVKPIKQNISKKNNFKYNNKSPNIQKIRFISSVLDNRTNKVREDNFQFKNGIIYENINFKNQFKELKKDFEIYDYNTNSNYIKSSNTFENKLYSDNFNTVRECPNNIIQKIKYHRKQEIIKKRKLNSAKVKNTSYHLFYPKEISPLYDYKYTKQFEDEKQNKPNNFCRKCGYQKHFGNERTCPLCVTLKEQNHLKEEQLDNKKYYFPFKNKYENKYHHSKQNSFRKHNNSFNTLAIDKIVNNNNHHCKFINIRKENCPRSFYNPFNINNVISSPNYYQKQSNKEDINYREIIKSRSNIYDKYDVVEQYFE